MTHWDEYNFDRKLRAFEAIGFTQGESVKLSSVPWSDFTSEVQKALKESDDAGMPDKDEIFDTSDNTIKKVGFDADEETGESYDYNNIGTNDLQRTKYQCEHCNSGYTSNESLLVHMNDIHTIPLAEVESYKISASECSYYNKSNEGRGDTYGRRQENLWPEHTDETQCITCGRSVSDHANPNTDYRGMNGDAPATDHYFQGGDMGGSDDKLYFESKASEDDPDFENDPDFEGKLKGVKVEPSQYTQDGMDHEDHTRGDIDFDGEAMSFDEDGNIIKSGKGNVKLDQDDTALSINEGGVGSGPQGDEDDDYIKRDVEERIKKRDKKNADQRAKFDYLFEPKNSSEGGPGSGPTGNLPEQAAMSNINPDYNAFAKDPDPIGDPSTSPMIDSESLTVEEKWNSYTLSERGDISESLNCSTRQTGSWETITTSLQIKLNEVYCDMCADNIGQVDIIEHKKEVHGVNPDYEADEANLIPMDAENELGDDPSKSYDDDGNEITESRATEKGGYSDEPCSNCGQKLGYTDIDSSGNYKCKHCNKSFSTESRANKYSHEKECDICGATWEYHYMNSTDFDHEFAGESKAKEVENFDEINSRSENEIAGDWDESFDNVTGKCKKCGYSPTSEDAMVEHAKSHESYAKEGDEEERDIDIALQPDLPTEDQLWFNKEGESRANEDQDKDFPAYNVDVIDSLLDGMKEESKELYGQNDPDEILGGSWGTPEDTAQDAYNMTSHNYPEDDYFKYESIILKKVTPVNNGQFSANALADFLRAKGVTSDDLIMDLIREYGKGTDPIW